MKPVLVDTGAIVSLLDRSERNHNNSSEAFEFITRPLITCEAVIAECFHLLRKLPGAQTAVLQNLERGILHIPWTLAGQEKRVSSLVKQYSKVPMDLADACLVCMAEDYGSGDILTLDLDFEVYRWSARKAFNLLIER
jgi:predicted nucleic acid-binding protein